MSLSDRLTHDIADAMRAREQVRLSALRMAKAALMNASVAKGGDLDETEGQQVLASLIKQRRDSIEQFRAAGRTDLVDRETAEIVVLERYAPPRGPGGRSRARSHRGHHRDGSVNAEGHGTCDEGCDGRPRGKDGRW